MNRRIWIITEHEFLKRVKSKWYAFTTVLAPFIFAGLIILPVGIMEWAQETDRTTELAVIDDTGQLLPLLQEHNILRRQYAIRSTEASPDTLRRRVLRGSLDAFLHLPEEILRGRGGARYYSPGGEGLMDKPQLERAIEEAVREHRLDQRRVPDSIRAIFRSGVNVRMIQVTPGGERSGNTAIFAAVGYLIGFLIYFMVFMYGMLVMRGVIEEKSNRVVELIASSARPFQLMMGKILGIGAVGLVQVTIWLTLVFGIVSFAGLLLTPLVDIPAAQMQGNVIDPGQQQAVLEAVGIRIPEIPASLFVYFLLFFLGGYLLYASLYAMVGSAVDQESDAQSLQLPIIMPLLIPILLVNYLIAQPNGTLSIVLSLVPFFSPVLMPVRAAMTPVPFWQVGAALLLLGLAFVGMVWIASRVYRVGILMYGKKATIRDLVKWIRYG